MKRTLLVAIFTIFVVVALAQQRKPILIGINPSITREKLYPKGAFDINVLPLVIEYQVVNNLDARVITVLNYGFRNYGSALINIGAELGVPYYFDFGRKQKQISKGFFVGPGAAFSRNVHYENNTFALFFETGYHFLYNDKFSFIIGLQYGKNYYSYDDGSTQAVDYFDVKVILGWWI